MGSHCLDAASVIGRKTGLPVGRLRKGRQLAHAFVILPDGGSTPDGWPCLDWSGVRRLDKLRGDMAPSWGRLSFDYDDVAPIGDGDLHKPRREIMRDVHTMPHIVQAMDVTWRRVSSTLHRTRLRYLDVIEVGEVTPRSRTTDVIDVGYRKESDQ